MLKQAVKLLRGSVCVRAKSAYPERMLNLCSARGIEFWDVRWIDDTALSFCVARGDLRALRRAAEAYMTQHRVRLEPQFDLAAVDLFPDGSMNVRFTERAMECNW